MNTRAIDDAEVYGLVERPEDNSPLGKFRLRPEVAAAFSALQHEAQHEKIDLQIASGFRSFDRQLSIWNRKLSGELPVLGERGEVLDVTAMDEYSRVLAVLRWSALPGASRHHWGTDIDGYDAAAMPEGYRLQLTQEEARTLFYCLHDWLDRRIASGSAHNFYRPYDRDGGGIAPEPWHVSFSPSARWFEQAFNLDKLARLLAATDIAMKEVILDHLDEIHQRFIRVPARG